MEWSRIASELEPDGSLRDIYVLGTGLADWQRVLDGLRASASELAFSVDGVPTALPERAADLFTTGARPLIRFGVGGTTVHCHAFAIDDIEFDFVPNDIIGAEQFDALVAFMRDLGEWTGKTVVMTPENLRESPFLRWEPGTRTLQRVEPA